MAVAVSSESLSGSGSVQSPIDKVTQTEYDNHKSGERATCKHCLVSCKVNAQCSYTNMPSLMQHDLQYEESEPSLSPQIQTGGTSWITLDNSMSVIVTCFFAFNLGTGMEMILLYAVTVVICK